ncbi:hypothetical protein Mcup_1085 [Metallosphaera cuprina Ar-4]|uniref:Uncharacterized protein n=1 Tax=Metallosphaera cuprina (strain Ar-4) TaxID=1006006 RepID=F4G2Z2_METCR|nr:hypothetical protein Mcup_1085 [Metallosphaera cuprina Ar-4]
MRKSFNSMKDSTVIVNNTVKKLSVSFQLHEGFYFYAVWFRSMKLPDFQLHEGFYVEGEPETVDVFYDLSTP